MSVDFPRAWQLTKATSIDDHHRNCSWRQSGCLLCDCDVIHKHPEYLSDHLYGKDGQIIDNL